MFNNYEFKIKNLLKKNDNLQLAEELCLEAIKKFPKNVRYQKLMNEIKVTHIKQRPSNNLSILQNYIKNNEYKKGLDYALNLIEIYPDNVDLLNNIGSFYFHLGSYDEAILFFEKVQSKDVKHHKSLNNLGLSFLKKSDYVNAIKNFKKALNLDAENYEYIHSLFNLLITLRPDRYLPDWAEGFEILLQKNKLLGHDKMIFLSYNAFNHLKKIDYISALIQKPNIETDDLPILDILFQNKILIFCLKYGLVMDYDFENLLTKIRSFYLNYDQQINININTHIFLSSLAQYNFFNNYIFAETDDDLKKLEHLEKKLTKSFDDKTPLDPYDYLRIACYRPLFNYKFSEIIPINDIIKELIHYTVINPKKEIKLIKKIKTVNEIKNDISLKIRDQYETFPYPSWVYATPQLHKRSISQYLKDLNIHVSEDFEKSTAKKTVLIAGCGTGKQVVEFALTLKNIEIVAIDLSKRSLGYAIRKCQEYNINNIKFFHCDILDIHKLNIQFDCIMCTGVLHHMKDPEKGLEELYNCLKKDGYIYLALYSKIARSKLKIFQDLGQKIKNIHNEKILRDFRKNLIDHHDFVNKISNLEDFYNLAEFKDIICNVQEHQYEINDLKNITRRFKMKFCGFQNLNNLHKKFYNFFKEKVDILDFENWKIYEESFPETFANMYQFWLKK